MLETTRLRRVVEVDGERGLVRAEAGATVEDVWRASVPLGWWPPVVPGTMKATLGGCVAMDVHGKNHLQQGSFGEHVAALSLLEPGGGPVTLTGSDDAPRLAQVIGAQGLTGTILEVTLRLERVRSGYLEVESLATASLAHTIEVMQERAGSVSYAVAWLDCFAPGRASGRGLVHLAAHLPPGHRLEARGLTLPEQGLPRRIFGVIPRERAWWALLPFASGPGMRTLNLARHLSGRARSGRRYLQSHAAFHFLLDWVPEWKRVYGAGGFLQYQLFVPERHAVPVFQEALRLQHRSGAHAWLAVLKRHRAGRFAAPYALDGYSLALDFPVRDSRSRALRGLCASYADLLRGVGGRIYAAQDAVGVGLLPESRHPLFSSNLVRRWESAASA